MEVTQTTARLALLPRHLMFVPSKSGTQKKIEESHDNELEKPQTWLSDISLLSPLAWSDQQRGAGGGLRNPDTNICFMNATLQALFYAPSFGEDLVTRSHSKFCRNKRNACFCAMCLLEAQACSLQRSTGQVLDNRIYMNVKRFIWKQYRIGRQEDAHEFLRYLMEALNKSFLPEKNVNRLKDVDLMTTYIAQQFGGWYKNTITCEHCGHISNKYEPFLDFQLEIVGVSTLEKALSRFVKPEHLRASNQYFCAACNTKRNASKRMIIHQAPRLLTIPLKRFGFTLGSQPAKNTRRIQFPLSLDLTPYTSSGTKSSCQYQLWAVVSHVGHSLRSGHYLTYAKAPNSIWYRFDDETVTGIGEEAVLRQEQNAYILFYSRIEDSKTIKSSESTDSLTESVVSATSTVASSSDLPTKSSRRGLSTTHKKLLKQTLFKKMLLKKSNEKLKSRLKKKKILLPPEPTKQVTGAHVTFDPKQFSNRVRNYASQYSVYVKQWSEGSRNANFVESQRALEPGATKRDEKDLEYDRGRAKKIKSKSHLKTPRLDFDSVSMRKRKERHR